MLKEKYTSVLKLGEELGIREGYAEEEEGKLKIGGIAAYQSDCDQIWDNIKSHAGWESEIEADIKVANREIYGHYIVQSGDSLSKIAKRHLGNASRYMDIFNLNKDILSNPDLIKVGQKLKIPNKS